MIKDDHQRSSPPPIQNFEFLQVFLLMFSSHMMWFRMNNTAKNQLYTNKATLTKNIFKFCNVDLVQSCTLQNMNMKCRFNLLIYDVITEIRYSIMLFCENVKLSHQSKSVFLPIP